MYEANYYEQIKLLKYVCFCCRILKNDVVFVVVNIYKK